MYISTLYYTTDLSGLFFESAYNSNAKVDPRADISVLASLLPEGVRVILDVS